MLTVLKLGGSLITDKSQTETVDFERLSAAIAALAAWHDADDELLLVHGGGSFGHHHAARYGLTQTAGKRDAVAVTDVHRAMGDLNDAVLAACHDRGIEAVPVRPLSVAHRSDEGELAVPAEPVDTLLGEGFVPVVPGDVIGHTGKDLHPEQKRLTTLPFFKEEQTAVDFYTEWLADSDRPTGQRFGGSLVNLERSVTDYDPDDASPWEWDLKSDIFTVSSNTLSEFANHLNHIGPSAKD